MQVSLKVFREAFITFFIGIIGSLGAGLVLSGMSGTLALVPGLALLIPGALGARGTIYGVLGAKLSSSLHLGLIKHISWQHKVIRENALFSHSATLFVSLILAFIASGLATLSGIEANPFLLFFISIVSGAISGIILILFTNVIAFQAFKRGWDPDNINAPLIATMGDFITVPILFGTALLAIYLPEAFIIVLVSVAIIVILWHIRGEFLTLRFLILAASIGVQALAGVFLERSIPALLAYPGILVFLPAFLAQGGNLSSFVASRLSTQLHLGTLKPEFKLRGSVVYEMITVILLSFFIFPILGFATFGIQELLNLPHLSILETVRISLEAGFLTTLLVAIVLGFSISILSWRLHVDPDDVTIPILSALADFFGILFLLAILF